MKRASIHVSVHTYVYMYVQCICPINAVSPLAGLGLGLSEILLLVMKSRYLGHCSQSDDFFMLA
jgi:hypothetical protein